MSVDRSLTFLKFAAPKVGVKKTSATVCDGTSIPSNMGVLPTQNFARSSKNTIKMQKTINVNFLMMADPWTQ